MKALSQTTIKHSQCSRPPSPTEYWAIWYFVCPLQSSSCRHQLTLQHKDGYYKSERAFSFWT